MACLHRQSWKRYTGHCFWMGLPERIGGVSQPVCVRTCTRVWVSLQPENNPGAPATPLPVWCGCGDRWSSVGARGGGSGRGRLWRFGRGRRRSCGQKQPVKKTSPKAIQPQNHKRKSRVLHLWESREHKDEKDQLARQQKKEEYDINNNGTRRLRLPHNNFQNL